MSIVKVFLTKLHRYFDGEDGQGLAEYALILALIAVLAIGALLFLSGAINDILSQVGLCLNSSGCPAAPAP
jgi:pilus assembly protein Flp/PilA